MSRRTFPSWPSPASSPDPPETADVTRSQRLGSSPMLGARTQTNRAGHSVETNPEPGENLDGDRALRNPARLSAAHDVVPSQETEFLKIRGLQPRTGKVRTCASSSVGLIGSKCRPLLSFGSLVALYFLRRRLLGERGLAKRRRGVRIRRSRGAGLSSRRERVIR